MNLSNKYHPAVLAFDALFLLFFCVAVYHLTQKPGLPPEFTSDNVLTINEVLVTDNDQIEFLTSAYRIGDTISIGSRVSPSLPHVMVRLEHYYTLTSIGFNAILGLIIFALGALVYKFRPDD